MPYLSGAQNEFERAISRDWRNVRSAQLDKTVAAVKKYISAPTADNLRAAHFFYDAWKHERPAEFKERGAPIELLFEGELLQECRKRNIRIEGDAARKVDDRVPLAPQVAVNRWTTPKRLAKTGLTTANAGITAAQNATGASLLGAATGAAVAVSATGVGLIVTSAAAMGTQSVLAASSAWKTNKHLDNLDAIYEKRDQKPFNEPRFCVMAAKGLAKTQEACVQHDMIANLILPYIIYKKDAKLKRKIVTAVPVVGTLETMRAIGKKAYKYAKGTLGVHRHNAAAWMACHLIQCDCLLVQAIVAELYSVGEMEWLKVQPYGPLIEFLEQKMKST